MLTDGRRSWLTDWYTAAATDAVAPVEDSDWPATVRVVVAHERAQVDRVGQFCSGTTPGLAQAGGNTEDLPMHFVRS